MANYVCMYVSCEFYCAEFKNKFHLYFLNPLNLFYLIKNGFLHFTLEFIDYTNISQQMS